MDVEEKEETLIRNAYVYLTKKTYPDGCTSNKKLYYTLLCTMSFIKR